MENEFLGIKSSYAFTEYFKYRLKAQGRHGTHSPFVYDFIENILQNRKKIVVNKPVNFPELTEKYSLLLNLVLQYYKYENMQWLPGTENIEVCDTLIFPASISQQWVMIAHQYFPLLKNNTASFILNIHQATSAIRSWEQLCNHPKVLMSIDVFGVGLLFFREDFKQKQHFTLKY